MFAEAFLREFASLTNRAGSIQKLRELVLQLAVRGKLVPQIPSEGNASEIALKASHVLDKISKPLAEGPYPIPSTWVWGTLGAVSNYGETEKVEPGTIEDPDFWVLELEDIEKTTSRLLARVPFRERDFRSSKNRFHEGQILYGKLRPYLDKVIIADREGCCTTEIVPFTVISGIDTNFIRWCVKAPDFISYADSSTYGMNLPRMGTKSALAAPIPLPPLAEQKRIAAKVDALMVMCDALEAKQVEEIGLKRAVAATTLRHLAEATTPKETADRWSMLGPHFGELFDDLETIKGLRATIFDLAVSGKLSQHDAKDDDPRVALDDIEDARLRIISSGIINRLSEVPPVPKVEAPYVVPESWEWIRYNSAFRFIDYRGKTPTKTNDGIPLITAKNVRRGYIDREPREFVSEATFKEWMTRGFPIVNDILLTVEAPLGNAALINIAESFALAQRVICLQPWEREKINSDFFLIAILSPLGQMQLQSQATGMTATGIKASKLKLIPLPFPPLAEQNRIVTKVSELMTICDQLEEQVRNGEQLNAELMASLVYALSEPDPDGGGLVAQSAGSVESAAVLGLSSMPSSGIDGKANSASARVMRKPESIDHNTSTNSPGVDTKFKEAVLVGTIVKAFFDAGGEPIGNFRLQKAVYFARRKLGEHVDEMAYLKKAAGPYNPSMKYSGGISIAKRKNWLREARGRFGFGHVPGPVADEMNEWVDRYGYGDAARWVAEQFRFKKNEEWEGLATVDYAIEHLQSLGIEPDAAKILQYIRTDDEWRPKIEKLRLTEVSIDATIVEVKALFGIGDEGRLP